MVFYANISLTKTWWWIAPTGQVQDSRRPEWPEDDDEFFEKIVTKAKFSFQMFVR